MALDHPASPISGIASHPGPANSTRYFSLVAADIRELTSAMSASSMLVLAGGAIASAAFVIGGIQTEMGYPLSLFIGYCALICSASLAVAINVLLRSPEQPTPDIQKKGPTYTAWKLVKKLRVSDASRLLCDIEPGSAATLESLAWSEAIFGAITSGELPISDRTDLKGKLIESERSNPSWATEIEIGPLKNWVASKGLAPRFLLD